MNLFVKVKMLDDHNAVYILKYQRDNNFLLFPVMPVSSNKPINENYVILYALYDFIRANRNSEKTKLIFYPNNDQIYYSWLENRSDDVLWQLIRKELATSNIKLEIKKSDSPLSSVSEVLEIYDR